MESPSSDSHDEIHPTPLRTSTTAPMPSARRAASPSWGSSRSEVQARRTGALGSPRTGSARPHSALAANPSAKRTSTTSTIPRGRLVRPEVPVPKAGRLRDPALVAIFNSRRGRGRSVTSARAGARPRPPAARHQGRGLRGPRVRCRVPSGRPKERARCRCSCGVDLRTRSWRSPGLLWPRR